jgi:hypothetical protein
MNIDPILRHNIEQENEFYLGKQVYCVNSLLDWFITRRSFIDPMTNEMMKPEDIKLYVDLLKKRDAYPVSLNSFMPHYRIIHAMEKHRQYNSDKRKLDDKIGKQEEKKVIYEQQLDKVKNRRNGNTARKLEQIEKVLQRLNKLQSKKIMVIEKYMGYLEEFSNSRRT